MLSTTKVNPNRNKEIGSRSQQIKGYSRPVSRQQKMLFKVRCYEVRSKASARILVVPLDKRLWVWVSLSLELPPRSTLCFGDRPHI